MGTKKVRAVSYAGDATLIEDDLQRLFIEFRKACKLFDLNISTSKIKVLTISKRQLRSKLVYQRKIDYIS